MKSILKKFAGAALMALLAFGMAGCKPSVEVHEHTNSDEWSFDGEYHWHAATCEHTEAVAGREPHSFGEWSEGKRSCSKCEYEQNCGHTWDEGVVTTVPTLVEEGVKTYTCTECGETKTEEIAKLAYNWYESPVDFVTGEAATANSEYVLFGVFPKTVLPLDSTVTVDENDKVEMGANTYYKGSDGEYYAKALENAYEWEEIMYKNGEQAKQKSAGSYRYFKVEPIKWKVLTTTYDIDGESGSATGALLLAEDILTANVPYYEDWENNRTIDGKTVYPNNYQHSQIRAYLNGLTYQGQSGEETKWNGNGFLQTAFTKAAQSKIVTTTVDNSAASTTDAENNLSQATSYKCENTDDKIFLLSEREVTTTAYGFAAYNSAGKGNARIRFPTDYAKANYAYQSLRNDYGGGYWWLRSPFCNESDFVRSVCTDGDADYTDNVSNSDGVVPALSISF